MITGDTVAFHIGIAALFALLDRQALLWAHADVFARPIVAGEAVLVLDSGIAISSRGG